MGTSVNDRDRRRVRVEQSAKLRATWSYSLASESQSAVCRLAAGIDPRRVCEVFVRNVPLPASRIEELVYHGMLFELMIGGFGRSAKDRRVKIGQALRSFTRTPRRTAGDTRLASRAAEWIRNDLVSRLNVTQMAHQLGCHETTLRRAFVAWAGESMRSYQLRARVREALRLFEQGVDDVLAVARLVGYRSEKNFYRAVRIVTGMTPGQIRRLPSGTVRIEIAEGES
jgi:AraC-like DNA-binding protein